MVLEAADQPTEMESEVVDQPVVTELEEAAQLAVDLLVEVDHPVVETEERFSTQESLVGVISQLEPNTESPNTGIIQELVEDLVIIPVPMEDPVDTILVKMEEITLVQTVLGDLAHTREVMAILVITILAGQAHTLVIMVTQIITELVVQAHTLEAMVIQTITELVAQALSLDPTMDMGDLRLILAQLEGRDRTLHPTMEVLVPILVVEEFRITKEI